MEGFFYDTEIEHISEIVKNLLYFAVLYGEDNRILKNTNDAVYFSVDDELQYFNYYFDFGPLNISCLYKYCCKLNNYLHYTRRLKRIVHYTTANTMKRVNAAYLIGSYSIIFLKMDPDEIYKILLNSGGAFRQFVDASQGISQYTINILDCFHAVHKAMHFNFFNFCDFNVLEYDTYDKLQNGDMNWLLPRKFLAFIGPTNNVIMNGHPPDYYIQYFLENDIKTVIRLNNKVYDATVFTNAGIEHHELFFPDGTIPSKQILLRFLSLSESARACVAVHCKAGLGRTGSLIGAYIIKHYRMSAHEAIAWMRICRPGSVIGQQQGWLEKIESWLWRQGIHYRIQHFGDGDRLPHHKYGIYSKMWPLEREKLIRHVQKRKLEAQRSNFRHKVDISDNMKVSTRCNYCTTAQKNSSKNAPKVTLAVPINEGNVTKPKIDLFNKRHQTDANFSRTDLKSNFIYAQDVLNRSLKQKRLLIPSKIKESLAYGTDSNTKNEGSQKRFSFRQELLFNQVKLRKRNQSESRDQCVEKKIVPRIQKAFVHNLEQTQGDKLNEIKAKRLSGFLKKEEKINEPGTSKKKFEMIMKQSQAQSIYSTKN